MQPNLKDNLSQWSKIGNYSEWLFKNFESYIGKRIIDIGIGVGEFETYFLDSVDMVIGLDLYIDMLKIVRKRFNDKINKIHLINDDFGSLDIDVLKEYQIDTVLCVNVLEHLEDDLQAIMKMKTVISNDGHIIILVPANNKLFNYMDKNAGHYRRYDKGALEKLASKAGLEIVHRRYINLAGIIPYYIRGKLNRNKEGTFSTGLNNTNSIFYNIATKIVSGFEKVVRVPTGLSELAVMRVG